MSERAIVIGGGLAGAEACWQLVRRGIPVRLYEMRPLKMTPAHRSSLLAELVCSNSLKADMPHHAAGILKREMRRLDSLIMRAADETAVPAGRRWLVDRERFAGAVTAALSEHPLCDVVREEVVDLSPTELTIVASGPVTSDRLAEAIAGRLGSERLCFFDAIAPIVYADSIDWERAFWASRYEADSADYANCPLTKDEYEQFWRELTLAETVELREFEDGRLFEGCLPIEQLARRGSETMRYGPLKPVGLIDPRTGERPYAVVQLRKETDDGRLLNMVGFQTNLKHGEQRRVFGLIPALRQARYARLGSMHRNTFINSPSALEAKLVAKGWPNLLFAGQLTGVEGYIESAATGLVAGINAGRLANGQRALVFPAETAIGALCRYVSQADPGRFQPMNINFGLFPPLEERNRDRRHQLTAERAMRELERFIANERV